LCKPNVDAVYISAPTCLRTRHFSTGNGKRGRVPAYNTTALSACV
jgi:hypothetical protein